VATNGLAAVLEHVDSPISTILHRALEGEEISWSEGLQLCESNGLDLQAVCLVADEMRRRQV
jgi:2-iminoacetate synthase ThiH